MAEAEEDVVGEGGVEGEEGEEREEFGEGDEGEEVGEVREDGDRDEGEEDEEGVAGDEGEGCWEGEERAALVSTGQFEAARDLDGEAEFESECLGDIWEDEEERESGL